MGVAGTLVLSLVSFVSALVQTAYPPLDRTLEFEDRFMSYNLNSAGEAEER